MDGAADAKIGSARGTLSLAQACRPHGHLADHAFEDLLFHREIVQHVANKVVDQPLQLRRARHATLLEAQVNGGEAAIDVGRAVNGEPAR